MLAWSGPLWAADTFAGRSLVEVLEQFRAEGMLVVYSSDVVDESLRVVAEPSAPTRELMLAEMLVALGLGLERRGDILLVVKPPSSADPPSQQGDVKNQLPSPQIENVVVHASRFAVGERAPASFALLRDNDIDQLVGAGREPLKTLARLPGMASSGLSSKQNVRGGEQDEMLLVFDGLPLFEPFHLKDFQSLFSTLDPRVVGAIEVYTGGFPAQYGDRLSGVIDVTPQPPADRPHHEIGVDFFNAGILSKGPFAQGQGEWLLSARRGTLDLLFDVVNTD
ncbi:MAG: TonB-dependent receptor plug domain-containing protein, partial [Gammaproteobacteria bacterium]|nr:TonB-dependent receptor plug domain-containing protein [Gammaproteobacteria bacterium]